ncbi:uncharacterized protein TrAtP1_012378 [Trichoderma atroviride]|uniref:uncharacterized protein n=1 Tax=Hypocrea atroviridis TaxID=63577 RepID=UPI003329B885|nr:hypothetical protein TrAtP1_012378 [Trichoderma atroviride]
MAPTPPSADSPSHDEKTRRNVACVNCRNSKVRCKSSTIPGQPCQRCAKLQISCVVDKSHKRVTKRSKLEQLEQELRSIQQVVNNKKANSESTWSPPSPLAPFSASSGQAPLSAILKPARTPLSIQLGPSPRPPDKRQKKTGPTEARVLNAIIISGEDIDYYFSKYLQHFHPFLPILRKKEPDECYDAQPVLFWAVLYVTCRRYAKDTQLFSALVEHMTKNLWPMMSSAVLGVDEIHAILLVCAWPYPTIRFVTDPSSMLVNIAMNACMSLGLHTGRGSHPQFCVGSRHCYTSTDEEASSTWIACCLLAQRISASAGLPPPFMQHSDVRCKAALESNYWADLLATYELQRFLNRFHMAMHAQTSNVGSVPESAIAIWENELETLKPLLVRFDTGKDSSLWYIRCMKKLTFAPDRSTPRLQTRRPARNPALLLHVPLHHHRKQQQLRHQHKLQHLPAPTRPPRLRPSAHPIVKPNSPAQRPQDLHHRPLPHPHRPRHRLPLQIHRPLPRRPLPRPHRRRKHNRLPPALHLVS